jgi:hypothetical protein
VPRWTGLDLDRPGLDVEIISNQRYSRKVVLVTPRNSAHRPAIEALQHALKSSDALQ